jgi:hypothetical protein
MANTNLLTKAVEVVTERQAKYGSPTEDFTRIAKYWSIYTGTEIKPEQVPMMMVFVKISRSQSSYHPDNALDICGYAQCHETVMEEKPVVIDFRLIDLTGKDIFG